MLKADENAKNFQRKMGKILAGIPLSPNQWTFLSLLAAFAASYCVIALQFQYAAALFAIAVVFDAIDGAVARATDRVTKFGAFLDGLADRLAEGALLFSLLLIDLPDRYSYAAIVLMLFFGTCMTSFVRAYAHHKGAIKENDVAKTGGFFERAERTMFMLLMLVSAFIDISWLAYLAYLGAALSIFTFLQRFLYIYARGKNE